MPSSEYPELGVSDNQPCKVVVTQLKLTLARASNLMGLQSPYGVSWRLVPITLVRGLDRRSRVIGFSKCLVDIASFGNVHFTLYVPTEHRRKTLGGGHTSLPSSLVTYVFTPCE